MFTRSDWKTRLAILGACAGVTVAVKVARLLVFWAQLALGPVRVQQRFKGQWALVTGGSEGVGKAVAAVLAGNGVHVILVSRSQAKLDVAANEIRQSHPGLQVRTFATDLTQPNSCQQLLQHLADTHTPISLLIANVGGGICGPKPYWTYTEDEETYVTNLNGRTCYSLVRQLLPDMIARGKGAVVAVSSVMHKWGAYAAPYGAEKAKMNALMAALDAELHGTGVTAQAMVLGPVDTPGVQQLLASHTPNNSSASTSTASSSSSSKPDADEVKPQASSAPASPAASSAAAGARQPAKAARFSADAVAAALVRAIGRGGPIITPYWHHAVLEHMLLDCWWPPSLQRAVSRSASRKFKATWDSLATAARASNGSPEPAGVLELPPASVP